MRTLNSYLSEYAESHQNPRNIWLHTICVPLIAWSVGAFAHTFSLSSGLSLAHAGAVAVLGFYATFKKPWLWLLTLLLIAAAFVSYDYVPQLRWTAVGVFVFGWIGQFYGHAVEGKRPSFVKDLLFLLIGPLWVIHKLAPRLTA